MVHCLAPFGSAPSKIAIYEERNGITYLSDRIPVRRPGQPGHWDVALVWLASKGSRYVMSQRLLVDRSISIGTLRTLPREPALK
jgi:hypothetical protein